MEPMSESEASPEELKKVLEWELSLDNTDLRSHAWYHGTIPRTRAEELVLGEGDFLIRDCISRPGDYVLTCRWRGTSLHFVINKVVFQPFTVYERIQYQFEDDCFDTVPDLVTYYVGNRRPISAASGAVVSRPVNRSMPLSYYATRYGVECQMHYAALERAAAAEEEERLAEESHPSGVSTMPRSASNDYPKKPSFSTLQHSKGSSPLDKKGQKLRSSQESVPDVLASKDEAKDDVPPPKPSRIPSKKYGCTSYSGSGDSVGSKSGGETPPPHLYSELNFASRTPPADSRTAPPSSNGAPDWSRLVRPPPAAWAGPASLPRADPPSSLDLDSFSTVLLASENKPLEPSALARVRCMLLEGGARVIAAHLTRTDLDALGLSGGPEGCMTGLELLVLPQGRRLRLDLLERTECLKFFVAISLLTCGDEEVRAQVLNKWIQIAVETKTALGNLYGFTGIMQGLALPQICRLKGTWLKLRQTCTENAFTYETKLRPTLKNMQECSNPQAPNTCIPYLLSVILILQRHLEVADGPEEDASEEIPTAPVDSLTSCNNKEKGRAAPTLGLPWEQTATDYGLQLLLQHLEAGRAATRQWPAYRRNSEIALEHAKYDDLLLDAFRTEFQMRFLWGSRGCRVAARERYAKFGQVLDLMSERCEPL